MLTFTNTKKTGPTIALCVIAKNEADMIADCLDSVKGFVDEIVVVDTGSTDDTVEIATAHGARVEHFEWINDFAAARNYAIEKATSDWILMLDADERLDAEGGPLLLPAARGLPDGYFAYSLQIENRVRTASMAHYMTRYFPRQADLRFFGSIHEELTPLGDRPKVVMQLPMVRIIHYGYDPDIYEARGKDARNMRMLERELEQDPDSARLLYYIMQQHCARKRYEDALPYAERFLANKSQLRPAFEVEVYRMWLEALYCLNRFDEAEEVLATAAKAGAVSSYGYEMVGNVEIQRNRFAESITNFEKARQSGLPIGLWGRPTGDDWQLGTKIADSQWELGNYKRSLTELEHVLPEVPEERRRPIALAAIAKSLHVHQYAAAYRWSIKAHELSGDDLSLHLELVDAEFNLPVRISRTGIFAGLDRAVASKNWQAVYDEARTLPLDNLAALARIIRITDKFIDEGAPDAALDLLERAMDVHAQEGRVYWNLAKALNALDRHAEAADALAVFESLQINQGVIPVAA